MNKIYILQTEQNILNIIAIKHFNFTDVVILKNQQFHSPFAEHSLQKYLRKEGYRTNELKIDPYKKQDIHQLKSRLNKDDIFVVPNSRYAYTLNILPLLQDQCKLAFVEEDGDIFIQKNGLFKELAKDHVTLAVEDFIENFGGSIKASSENTFDQKAANQLFDIIIRNLEVYQKMLKPSPIKIDTATGAVVVKQNSFTEDELSLMTQLLETLSVHHICAIHKKKRTTELYFYDNAYKDFIGKAGTWLEMATYKALKNISCVDSPKSSVFFYWNKHKRLVSNEIDVMGTFDNHLILISCKDTGHNLEKALYELYTHGEQLGFSDTIKILVTTSKPGRSLLQRSKELGIDIVRFDESIESLTSKLETTLK